MRHPPRTQPTGGRLRFCCVVKDEHMDDFCCERTREGDYTMYTCGCKDCEKNVCCACYGRYDEVDDSLACTDCAEYWGNDDCPHCGETFPVGSQCCRGDHVCDEVAPEGCEWKIRSFGASC